MRIIVPGATGVLGRAVVPLLVEKGHEVAGVARSSEGKEWLERSGAHPLEVDLFDPAAVAASVAGAQAVINLATAIPSLALMSRRRAWRLNDRLRTEAVDNLVEASLEAGVPLLVQPSVTLNYADGGSEWLNEESPLDPPLAATESALYAEDAIRQFTAAGGRGVVLRLSRLYGPGRASSELLDMVRRGQGAVVGDGGNFTSNLHVEDAGTAVAAAMDTPEGTYNVTDDRPVTALEWMSAVAAAVKAPAPRQIPRWLARTLLGSAFRLLTISQRVSNRRFRQATGWEPHHPDPLVGVESLA